MLLCVYVPIYTIQLNKIQEGNNLNSVLTIKYYSFQKTPYFAMIFKSATPRSSTDTRRQLRSQAGPPECETFGREHIKLCIMCMSYMEENKTSFTLGTRKT